MPGPRPLRAKTNGCLRMIARFELPTPRVRLVLLFPFSTPLTGSPRRGSVHSDSLGALPSGTSTRFFPGPYYAPLIPRTCPYGNTTTGFLLEISGFFSLFLFPPLQLPLTYWTLLQSYTIFQIYLPYNYTHLKDKSALWMVICQVFPYNFYGHGPHMSLLILLKSKII